MSNTIPSRKNSARRVAQAGAILAAIGAGYTLRDFRADAQNGASTTPPPTNAPVVETPAVRDAAAMQNAFNQVSQASQNAVVTITTVTKLPETASSTPGGGSRVRPFGQNGDPNGDFQEFFKQFQRDFGFNDQSYEPNSWQGRVLKEQALVKYQQIQSRRGGGLGSGMIYRSDGLILTNAHVVRGADTVSVELSDGRKFEKAKVLGRDERTDIAVVKIDATDLPVVKFGDSDKVNVGDWAIAVGNPFGLDHTVTVGVISAKSRELRLAEDSRTDYLQTDASINPGNSGGPLMDIYGRVIGINNAIYSESGGNQGIGFAIPVNTARYVADRIVKDGRVRRGYLGVKISNVEDRGVAFGLDPKLKGVLIEEISDPTGPGAKAGLQPGDVVTKFNNTPVERSSELQRLVGNTPVGTNITLTVNRSGKTLTLNATLAELTDSTPQQAEETPEAPGKLEGTPSVIPGAKVRELNANVARQLGIKATSGVVITDVSEDGAAADADLQKGDVIEKVAQTTVNTVAELQTAVKNITARQTGEKKVALYINRNGQRSYIIVTLP